MPWWQTCVGFFAPNMLGCSFAFEYDLTFYLVQSNPVPGAAWEAGGYFEFDRGISNTIPLILHDEVD